MDRREDPPALVQTAEGHLECREPVGPDLSLKGHSRK